MLKSTLIGMTLAVGGLFLTGCEMYFDDSHPGPRDGWRYCDDTGCYWCDDYGCYPDGDGGWGYCSGNDECAPGCRCDDGICVDSDFCFQDADCPEGYICDARETCVPDGDEPPPPPPPTRCDDNDDCAEGERCSEESHVCVPCGEAGCEEIDPRGECDGEIACSDPKPECPEGTTPGILDGCWTGYCILISTTCVPPPPTCPEIASEAECMDRDDCQPVYVGVNCTCGPDCSCTGEEAGCVCERFDYYGCGPAANTDPA